MVPEEIQCGAKLEALAWNPSEDTLLCLIGFSMSEPPPLGGLRFSLKLKVSRLGPIQSDFFAIGGLSIASM